MRCAGLSALLLAGGACTEPGAITLDITENPIAVGANVDVVLEHRICDDGGVRCDGVPVTLSGVSLEPAGVFEMAGAPGQRFSLRAVAEGTATLRFDAESDGAESRTITRTLVSLAPESIAVMPPCASPLTYTVSTRAEVPYELRHGDTALHGSDFYPFDATGVTIATDASTSELLVLTMPAAPGTGQLSSPIDASFTLAFEAIAPSSIDAVAFGEPSPPDVFRRLTVPVTLGAAGQPVCGDSLTRVFATSTPEACVFDHDGADAVTFNAVGVQEVAVRGRAAGACTISVTLGGTGLGATKTIVFAM